jgi:hypothetical protein
MNDREKSAVLALFDAMATVEAESGSVRAYGLDELQRQVDARTLRRTAAAERLARCKDDLRAML